MHAPNQTILNVVGVLDHLVGKHFAIKTSDDLMNGHCYKCAFAGTKCDGFDVRIDERPLPAPILTYAVMAENATAFHPVRPIDFGMHNFEYRVDHASVEVSITTDQ